MAAKKNSKARAGSSRGTRVASTSRARATTETSAHITLRRVSKGKRPQFHDSEAVDQLFAIVTALTAELSVAFDRIDTLERVLVAAGAITDDCVETYQPSGAAAEARSARREGVIQRVFSVFEAYGAPAHS